MILLAFLFYMLIQNICGDHKYNEFCYHLNQTNVNIVGTSLFHNLLHIFIYHDQMKQIMVYHIPLVNIVPLMGKIFINHNVRKSSLKEFIGYDPILLEKKIPKSIFHLELPKFVDDQITLCFIFPNTDLVSYCFIYNRFWFDNVFSMMI